MANRIWLPTEQPIAKNVLTMLVNLSADNEILQLLAEDDAFLETLLVKLTVREWLLSASGLRETESDRFSYRTPKSQTRTR